MYKELVESKSTEAAIQLLKTELRPRCPDQARLHKLAQLVLTCNPQTTQVHLETEYGTPDRQDLLTSFSLLLDPTQLMPERRLSTLLDHAVERQLSLCKFHNCSDQRISLLFEHQCA